VTTVRARRACSLAVLVVVTTGFAGGRGWVTGRVEASPIPEPPAEQHAGRDEHAGHGSQAADAAPAHHGHEGHHATPQAADGHKSHGHDCENGVCRCDSKCPPRRSGPCGGALRSCSSSGDEAGAGPGPARPFLLAAGLGPRLIFDSTRLPDATFLRLSRDLEPVSPPPRTSAA
jgi:hypothetical protein